MVKPSKLRKFKVGQPVRLVTPYAPDGYPMSLGVISEVVAETPHFKMYSVAFPGYRTSFVDFRNYELLPTSDRGRTISF